MNILADQYIYKLSEFIPEDVVIDYYKPENGLPSNVTDYDAFLFRTVTIIDYCSLPHAGNLKFAGTATAGFDHVDTAHLKKLGIEFARSAGCNANAVAEYVITALYRWADVTGSRLEDKKIGIVGMGHTGGNVASYLNKLDIRFAGFDPPKQVRESGFLSCTLEELLECDILTFHVPLTRIGEYPTYHMCSSDWLRHGFDLIVNAARGGIVDEISLHRAKTQGLIRDYILDVWENEPLFSNEIAEKAFIATPHIAGYSKQAKWLASKMVADQMCDYFGLKKQTGIFRMKPPQNLIMQKKLSFARFLWDYHMIDYYDAELRKILHLDHSLKKERFSLLRSETETRFEFEAIIKEITKKAERPQKSNIFL